MGGVRLGRRAGKDADFSPLDDRGDAPDVEGKTKNDHLREMVVQAVAPKGITARTRVFAGG
jgi:hypothetical protein